MTRPLLVLSLVYTIAFAQISGEITSFAFGSCADQNKNQDILYHAIEKEPDVFIFLGDNIYGDSKNMEILRRKYAILESKEAHQAIRQQCEVLAVWDDHDYGKNDAGRKYKSKVASKELFLEFWREPKNSNRYDHEGIYHSVYYGSGERIVQVILLDTRTFRTRLKYAFISRKYKNDYRPNFSEKASILGEAQWLWLRDELAKPAKVRIIASSNQFGHEHNGYESWTNFPLEQEKFLQTIQDVRAEGVIFISGDVHWGEISRLENDFCYPIFDVTSSGLTQTWHKTEENRNRVGAVIPETNFGLIRIDWQQEQISLALYDQQNVLRTEEKVPFNALKF